MLKIEDIEVFGWEAAIRGMRNPKNSWDKSDSSRRLINWSNYELGCDPIYEYKIGDNDLKLIKTLSKAGNDHAKFLRMINVTMDITAPLYWWKEFDTYKVGTVANSCSTMHKIEAKEFTLEDFSTENLFSNSDNYDNNIICEAPIEVFERIICTLNIYRKLFVETKDKKYWWQMIQLLPSSYNQKRTVQVNYAVLKNMYYARKNHKLDEWHTFCDICEELPYFEDICLEV